MSYRLIFAKGHAIARAKGVVRNTHHSPYRKGEEPDLPKIMLTTHSPGTSGEAQRKTRMRQPMFEFVFDALL